jgi:hypothetical protein
LENKWNAKGRNPPSLEWIPSAYEATMPNYYYPNTNLALDFNSEGQSLIPKVFEASPKRADKEVEDSINSVLENYKNSEGASFLGYGSRCGPTPLCPPRTIPHLDTSSTNQ